MKVEEQDPEEGEEIQWENELFQQKAIMFWRQKDMVFGTTVMMLQRFPSKIISGTQNKTAVPFWYLIRFLNRHSSLKKKEVKEKWKE